MSFNIFNINDQSCPNCGSTEIRSVNGSRVCTVCGTVITSRVIDIGPEWRNFGGEKDRSRVGPPQTSLTWNIGSEISVSRVSGPSGRLSSKNLDRIWANIRLHKRIKKGGSREKNFSKARSFIMDLSRIVEGEGITVPGEVIETAMLYYRKYISTVVKSRPRSIKCFAAASFLIACQVTGLGLSIGEFAVYAERYGISPRSLSKCYRKVLRVVDKRLIKRASSNVTLHLKKAVISLKLPPEVMVLANNIIKVADENGLISGKSRRGLAAAVTYIAAKIHNFNVTQEAVAKALRTTPVTVRERYKDLIKNMEITLSI